MSRNYGSGRGGGYGHGYGNQRSRSNENFLRPGQCGLFFTVDGDEKRANREALNVIGHFLTVLDEEPIDLDNAGQSQDEQPMDSLAAQQKEEDVADTLSKACHDLAAQKKRPAQQQRWGHSQIVKMDTSAKNTLFFTSPGITPKNVYKFADAIVDECQQTPRSRFLAKIMPVEMICQAQSDEFCAALTQLITAHLKAFFEADLAHKAPTYAVEFSHRNTDAMKRQDVYDQVTALMKEYSPASTVDLTKPDLLFVVQAIRRVVLLSCVREYFSRRKFSVRPPVEKQEENKDGDENKSAQQSGEAAEEKQEEDGEVEDPADDEWH